MEERLKIETLNGLKYFLADQKTDAIELCLIDIDGDMTNDELAIVSYLADNFDQLQSHVKNIVLEVPYEKISKRDFETFLKLYEKTSSSTIDLKFCVLHRLEHGFSRDRENIYWDFETIAKANKQIDHVCEFLKSSDLSPFEMLAFIHDYVSCLVPYTELPGKREWVRLNQFFPGAYLNSPDFICSGFSTLMEEIIDNLNIPGLKCKVIAVEFKNLDNGNVEKHARCIVKVKDEKYGLDQTLFEDPTWDNEQNLVHKYAHFAMPNDSLAEKNNKKYYYYIPEVINFSQHKSIQTYVDYNDYSLNFNRSKNKISQKMIEMAYFKMLKAKYSNKDFDQLYQMLEKIAKDSFDEQTFRKFNGNLKSENLQLSRTEAKELFDESNFNDFERNE